MDFQENVFPSLTLRSFGFKYEQSRSLDGSLFIFIFRFSHRNKLQTLFADIDDKRRKKKTKV